MRFENLTRSRHKVSLLTIRGHFSLGLEFSGKARIGGQSQDLELTIGLPLFHSALSVSIKLAGLNDTKHWRIEPRRVPLGCVFHVMRAERPFKGIEHGLRLPVLYRLVKFNQVDVARFSAAHFTNRRNELVAPKHRSEGIVNGCENL